MQTKNMFQRLYLTLRDYIACSLVGLFVVVGLFYEEFLNSASGTIGYLLLQLKTVCFDVRLQWTIFLAVSFYTALFIAIRFRAIPFNRWIRESSLWLIPVSVINGVVYSLNYPSQNGLTLLFGACLGQGVFLLALLGFRHRVLTFMVVLLCGLLFLASTCDLHIGPLYEYRNQIRATGPWNDPNIFGLLMGTGIVMAISRAVQFLSTKGQTKINVECCKRKVRKLGIQESSMKLCEFWRLVKIVFFLIAAGFMARGLVMSYSRGAWLATLCGVIYLAWNYYPLLTPTFFSPLTGGEGEPFPRGSSISWFKANRLTLAVILISVFFLSFWQFRQMEWYPAHRAFSAVNTADFSWRNRIAAWEGALQITSGHPWFGAGWNKPEPLYEAFHLPPKLNESAAIQLNDYLMLGATLGIPALFCLGMYFWLSLFQSAEYIGRRLEMGDGQEICSTLELNWLRTTCRSGAFVLAVGYWFDDGLFQLATASTFWILLELGSVGNHEILEPREMKTGNR